MKKLSIIICLLINLHPIFSQISLIIDGTVVNNTETSIWDGVNIQRNVPTTFIYRNNSITSKNASGYLLQAGDEVEGGTNNNLDGEIITGNKLIWNGTDMTSICHGLFTGCNINAVVKYNYLQSVPMAIIRKSASNMTNSSGGVAYNILNKTMIGTVVKGMSNVCIYNNTYYSDRTFANTNYGRGIIDVYSNTDVSPKSVSHGTKIKNNIFYTKYQINNIRILDSESLTGFESDYNLFYCETGTPMFDYMGSQKTFAQWQALGYDTHSIVANPGFTDFINFVPAARLNYGTNLGSAWQAGLSTSAVWTVGSAPATTDQNGTWQVGARIYDASPSNPNYISSAVENATPALLEITYSLNLANIIPITSAFNVQVNSINRVVNSVAISGQKVQLTLASPIIYGDLITFAYTKPSTNPLQTSAGKEAASISAQKVTNNVQVPPTPGGNQPPRITISNPSKGNRYVNPADIEIEVIAVDPDGTISKVELFNGAVKLAELTTEPYSYAWKGVSAGTYQLNAVATDNLNAISSASQVEFIVGEKTTYDAGSEIINLFPNPNNGNFNIEFSDQSKYTNRKIVISDMGGKQIYNETISDEETIKQLDVPNIRAGIYILMVICQEIIVTKKFIKK